VEISLVKVIINNKMSHLIKTPLFSYLVNYFNDGLGFRETKIISINKSGAKNIEKYKKEKLKTNFVKELTKNFSLENCIIQGSFEEIYPLHVQIELTDNCNLFCDYCYRNAEYKNPASKYIDKKEIQKFLLQHKKKNLLEVGITGGEPTLHPEFLDIMDFTLKNFELVELVTNGTNYKDILELIDNLEEQNKRKLNLSVSFNEWFRNLEKFEKGNHYLNKTIKEVTERHPVRIILTDYLYDCNKAKKAKKLLKNLGVKDFDFSFVSPIGRGKNKINELEYISLFEKNEENSFTPNPFNCGLIFKHTAIDPEGNFRPCALFPLDFRIGSIKKNFIEEYKILGVLPSPNKKYAIHVIILIIVQDVSIKDYIMIIKIAITNNF
jgi:MoaA/NifB/PqqE/SkfB family radical SAM enzyme